MGELIIAGLGLRPEQMSFETARELARCERVYSSVHGSAVSDFLKEVTKAELLFMPGERAKESRTVEEILAAVAGGKTVGYVAAGNPMILSDYSGELAQRCRAAGLPCRVLPALSSLDALLCTLAPRQDQWAGVQVIYGPHLEGKLAHWDPVFPVILIGMNHFCQDNDGEAIRRVAERIRGRYPARHPFKLIEYGTGGKSRDVIRDSVVEDLEGELLSIREFPKGEGRAYMGSLYFPPLRRTGIKGLNESL